jgi:NitT/TauT family transport system substrate-binding protein
MRLARAAPRGSLMSCALGITFVALLTSCGSPAPPAPVTLRMGYFPTQDFLPYFVMQEQGFARHNGLRLEERPFAGGAGAIDAMATGSLDLCPAVGTVPVLMAAARGLVPSKVVPVASNNFADPDHHGIGVVVGSSVQSWKDLEGQRIAVNAKTSITTAAVSGRLRLEQVNTYTLVEVPFTNMGLAVAGGNVAAAGMYEPSLTQSLLRGDGKLLGWVAGGGQPLERTEVTAIVVSADLHQRDPRAVKAYLRAHLQAVAWVSGNRAKARAILARRLDLTREVGEKFNLLRWAADARNDPNLLDDLQPLLIDIGVLKHRIAARQLYDETLLEQALAEKGSARR